MNNKKRPLRFESLENREMLSVNPLTLGYDAPEFVQTVAASQDFSTEAVTNGSLTSSDTRGLTVNLDVDLPSNGIGAGAGKGGISYTYKLYMKSPDATSWSTVTNCYINESNNGGPDLKWTFHGTSNLGENGLPGTITIMPHVNGGSIYYGLPITATSGSYMFKFATAADAAAVYGLETTLDIHVPVIGDNTALREGGITVALSNLDPERNYEVRYAETKTTKTINNGEALTLTLSPDKTSGYATLSTTVRPGSIRYLQVFEDGLVVASAIKMVTASGSVSTGDVGGVTSTLTGGAVVTNLTSTTATFNIPKVAGAKSYSFTVMVGGVYSVYSYSNGVITDRGIDITALVTDFGLAGKGFTTKTAVALTNLTAGAEYYVSYTAFAQADGTDALSSKTVGTFKTVPAGPAVFVAAPAINGKIAAVFKKGVGLNITWAAPANYTGGYTVGVEKWTGSSWGSAETATVSPGKTAAVLASGTDNAYYRITVKTDGANAVVAPAAIVGVGTNNKVEDFTGGQIGYITTDGTASGTALDFSSAANKTDAKLKVSNLKNDGSAGSAIKVKWTAPATVTNLAGYLITIQNEKGIVYQGAAAADAVDFDGSSVAGFVPVPGLKYDVNVTALYSTSTDEKITSKSAAVKVSITLPKFADPKLVLDKPGLTSVKIKTGTTDTVAKPENAEYFLEYTTIVDAKGKADWATATATRITAIGSVPALSGLKSGTQYYARLVAVNKTAVANGSDATSVVIGNEVKFKTTAAPAVTITKPAFSLTSFIYSTGAVDFLLKFSGKLPVPNTGLLTGVNSFWYEVIVSDNATIDKTTGKLASGQVVSGTVQNVQGAANDSSAAKVKKGDFTAPIVVYLTGTSGALIKIGATTTTNFKALNFQLLIHYSSDTESATTYDPTKDVTTAYTKVAKLTMPKWFV
ncbi:hypothetical protein FACS1894189_7900 [Planctomycetales bacterium]|nr:hypothetical protein FACS1894189_7900 [Planctomycetales bacterium]